MVGNLCMIGELFQGKVIFGRPNQKPLILEEFQDQPWDLV